MNIVGLGDAGCNIADTFSKYPQYEIYKINLDIAGPRCYNISKCKTAEDYEEAPLPKIKSFFKGMKGETLFIVGGSGEISCTSLKILENIKKLPISILYVEPDMDVMNQTQELQERVVKSVLQEYARSGVFEKMYIVSNPKIESVIGGAPIIGYYDKLNETLVSTIHMLNVCENTKPIIGKIPQPKITHRIISVGMLDIDKGEEKMFFSLDSPRERCYIYSINEERLKTDEGLFTRLKNQIKSKSQENLNISFAVYANNFGYDLGYVMEKTPHIQINNKPAG